MTDPELSSVLATVMHIELTVRAYLASTTDLPERDASLVVVRQATSLRRALETWMTARACRAHLQTVGRMS